MSTPKDYDAEFKDIAKEFYPGSHQEIVRDKGKIKRLTKAPQTGVDPDWDRKPHTYLIGGVQQEFFSVGNLASALGRRPGTIRAWERAGVIPKATYLLNAKSRNGRRRVYTRQQVEGMVLLAHEEGILLNLQKSIQGTQFAIRVFELFKQLAANK